jgi:CubicO group peptidase (beta-lactamase class C family)
MPHSVDLSQAVSPERVGISSRSVLRFLDRIDGERIPMHGFMLVRRNQVAAEGYWAPYTAESRHRMYSVSKSFVSLAVGLMIGEGKLKLDDRVATYFPDKVPEPLDPYLAQATVQDLLMMATPHSATSYTSTDTDWAWTFFNKAPSHPQGTIFSYDTAATVVLGTIVERLSGLPFLEYMRPALLDPLGFSKDAWCIETPEGTSWGGSGVICTLRDMSKVANVCMNRGRWGDRQLLPEEYVVAATSKQIDNTITFGKHGYGYQIWRIAQDGFAFVGMGSQLAYCFPERDFQFTCISDTQGIGATGTGVVEAMWQELYAELSDEPLPEDPEGVALLQERLKRLAILPQAGEPTSPWTDRVNGVWYQLRDNPMGIRRLRFSLAEDEGRVDYENEQGEKTLHFGLGRQVAGTFPQRNYFGKRIGEVPGVPYGCLASAAWVEEHKLNVLVYITDNYLGTLKMSFAFKGAQIGVYMTKVAEWFLNEYQGFAGGEAE